LKIFISAMSTRHLRPTRHLQVDRRRGGGQGAAGGTGAPNLAGAKFFAFAESLATAGGLSHFLSFFRLAIPRFQINERKGVVLETVSRFL